MGCAVSFAVSPPPLSPANMDLLRKWSRGCLCPSTPSSLRSAPRPSMPPLSSRSSRSTASIPAGASATCASLASRTRREERLAFVCHFSQGVDKHSFIIPLCPLAPDLDLQGDQLADDPHRGRRHPERRARDAERSHPPHYQHVQDPGHSQETGQTHTHTELFRLSPVHHNPPFCLVMRWENLPVAD